MKTLHPLLLMLIASVASADGASSHRVAVLLLQGENMDQARGGLRENRLPAVVADHSDRTSRRCGCWARS